MSSLPPELRGPVEQLGATLVEINGSELTCMTDAVASASHGKSLPEVQAVMARCRKTSAAAFASEAAALLPVHGPDKTTQEITNTCSDRASTITRYFEQLTS